MVKPERRITCYPPEKYAGLVKAYAKLEEVSESQIANQAVKCFIDNLPKDVKDRIVRISKNGY